MNLPLPSVYQVQHRNLHGSKVALLMGEGTASLLKAMPRLEIQPFCILPPQNSVVGASRLVGGTWRVGGHGTSDDTKYSTSSKFWPATIEMASNEPCYAPQCRNAMI